MLQILLLLSTIVLGADSFSIRGRVIDARTSIGISDVNLYIPKQKEGTATNADGSFYLIIESDKKSMLLVSHIGYSSKKISIKENSEELIITLDEIFFKAEDVVVTGTRTNKLYKDVPIATEVITKKDIENSGSINVKELLLTRSGVNINPSVYGGSELNILGMDSRNILIMIDGQPITGKFYDRVSLDHISIGNIDKIEITKGPSSSLYGSDAMAGVINIITNSNIDDNYLNLYLNYSLPEEVANSTGLINGSKRYKLGGPKHLGDLSISINTNIEQISTDKLIKESDIDNITKYSLSSLFQWKLNKYNTIKFRNSLYQHYENGVSSLIDTKTTIKQNNISLNHNLNIDKDWIFSHIFQRQTYSRNYTEKWNTGPYVGTIETDGLADEYFHEYECTLNKKYNLNSLNLGMETSYASYNNNRIGVDRQFIYANSFFSQYDALINNYYNVIIGLRLDKYSDYNYVYSPRIGFMYTHDKRWKFRTSWGKGFRTPSFMERFIDYDHSDTFGYKVIGNNDLKAEESNGITAGVEYFHPTVYQVSLMIYYTEFVNHIAEYYRGNQEYSYHNINNTYKGLEIRGKWKASNKLSATWEINLIDNRYSNGSLIPNTQPISVSNRFSYQSPKYPFGISTNMKWTGPYKPSSHDIETGTWVKEVKDRSGYIIFDISGNYTFNNFTKIKFGIKNVSNYVNTKYGPFIGRSFYIELSTQLNRKE